MAKLPSGIYNMEQRYNGNGVQIYWLTAAGVL
jgi:hypothetical protein